MDKAIKALFVPFVTTGPGLKQSVFYQSQRCDETWLTQEANGIKAPICQAPLQTRPVQKEESLLTACFSHTHGLLRLNNREESSPVFLKCEGNTKQMLALYFVQLQNNKKNLIKITEWKIVQLLAFISWFILITIGQSPHLSSHFQNPRDCHHNQTAWHLLSPQKQ